MDISTSGASSGEGYDSPVFHVPQSKSVSTNKTFSFSPKYQVSTVLFNFIKSEIQHN